MRSAAAAAPVELAVEQYSLLLEATHASHSASELHMRSEVHEESPEKEAQLLHHESEHVEDSTDQRPHADPARRAAPVVLAAPISQRACMCWWVGVRWFDHASAVWRHTECSDSVPFLLRDDDFCVASVAAFRGGSALWPTRSQTARTAHTPRANLARNHARAHAHSSHPDPRARPHAPHTTRGYTRKPVSEEGSRPLDEPCAELCTAHLKPQPALGCALSSGAAGTVGQRSRAPFRV